MGTGNTFRRTGDLRRQASRDGYTRPDRGDGQLKPLVIVGPTASGKSDLAVRLSRQTGAEILSTDSMQVYRGMDIGTAKPPPALRAEIPHHLIDIVEPTDAYSVAEFQAAGRQTLADLGDQGVPAIIAGGSGLHTRALVDPLEFAPTDDATRRSIEGLPADDALRRLLDIDPDAGNHVALANPRRVTRALEVAELTGVTPTERARSAAAVKVRNYEPHIAFIGIGVDPGDALAHRVRERLDKMLSQGFLDEIESLRGRLGVTAAQAVGYKELLPVVEGTATLAEGRAAALAATLALAKRQRTFFRRDPRISWLAWHDDPERLYQRAREALEERSWNS